MTLSFEQFRKTLPPHIKRPEARRLWNIHRMNTMSINDIVYSYNTYNTTAQSNLSTLCVNYIEPWPITVATNEKQEQKETAMSYETETRNYLLHRVEDIYYGLNNKLPAQFNLYVSNQPKTYKELIDAIKNDKFKLDEKRIARAEYDEDYFDFCGPFDGIIWDGPQPDVKGHGKAKKALKDAYNAAKDAVMIGTAAEGGEALKALQEWKPEGLAN